MDIILELDPTYPCHKWVNYKTWPSSCNIEVVLVTNLNDWHSIACNSVSFQWCHKHRGMNRVEGNQFLDTCKYWFLFQTCSSKSNISGFSWQNSPLKSCGASVGHLCQRWCICQIVTKLPKWKFSEFLQPEMKTEFRESLAFYLMTKIQTGTRGHNPLSSKLRLVFYRTFSQL